MPVALGRGGIKADKREGDGGTPRGRFRPVRLWWRADRLAAAANASARPPHRPRPRLGAKTRPTGATTGRSARSANEPGDRLWREDRLYDLVIEIDHNARPRVAWRGSAVFIHIARAGFAPTAGCVALRRQDLTLLLSRITTKTRIVIQQIWPITYRCAENRRADPYVGGAERDRGREVRAHPH